MSKCSVLPQTVLTTVTAAWYVVVTADTNHYSTPDIYMAQLKTFLSSSSNTISIHKSEVYVPAFDVKHFMSQSKKVTLCMVIGESTIHASSNSHIRFYRAAVCCACKAQYSVTKSVHLSVHQTVILYLSECTYHQTPFTVWQWHDTSFLALLPLVSLGLGCSGAFSTIGYIAT